MSTWELTDIVRRLESLIGREHVSEDYVRFRVELLTAQAAVREALARSDCSSATGPSDAEHGAQFTVLDPSDVLLDRALLARLLEDLGAALRKRGQRSEDLTRLSAAATKDPELIEQVAGKAVFGPDESFLASLSKRLDVSIEALLFFGRALSAPFVTVAVGRLKQRALVARKAAGRCPWCGSPPGLAMLNREGGQRVLFCSLCGERWEFARVECPFCGSRRGLEMLAVGTADLYSIETCGQCKGYLKTVEERQLPEGQEVVPLVETTASLYVDLIAEKEGCARALPYVALR